MTEPPKKIEILRAHMAAGRWREAIALASTFGRLGEEKAAILSAREAYMRPDFQRQVGKDPAALIAAGREALERRYGRAEP